MSSRPTLFAIDYDATFTADPEGFRALVALMRARGHSFVLVTGRSDDGHWGSEVREAVGDLMPIVFANGGWKRTAAKRAGFRPDVWIDDTPASVEELPEAHLTRKRQFEAAAVAWEEAGRNGG